MKTIKTYLKTKQAEFALHPFFEKLQQMSTVDDFKGFVKYLAFWPMAFQDVLRLNEVRVTNEYLHKVARHHRLEDAGHDRWYINDVNYFDKNSSSGTYYFDLLFNQKHTQVRDASYAILAEVFALKDDKLRVILLLTLESAGHVFFEKTSEKLSSTNKDIDDSLLYFSTSHWDVEQAHEVFEEAMERELLAIVLTESTRREAIELVDRVYDAFKLMFDGLIITIDEYGHTEKTTAVDEQGLDVSEKV